MQSLETEVKGTPDHNRQRLLCVATTSLSCGNAKSQTTLRKFITIHEQWLLVGHMISHNSKVYCYVNKTAYSLLSTKLRIIKSVSCNFDEINTFSAKASIYLLFSLPLLAWHSRNTRSYSSALTAMIISVKWRIDLDITTNMLESIERENRKKNGSSDVTYMRTRVMVPCAMLTILAH